MFKNKKDKAIAIKMIVSYVMLGVITIWLLGLPLWMYLITPNISEGFLWVSSIFDWIALILIPVVMIFHNREKTEYRELVEDTADRYGVEYTNEMKNEEILRLVDISHERKNDFK